MLDTPNVWVVGGLPGSGKSTITDQLIASGEFDGFEVSANHTALVEKLGPARLDALFDASRFSSPDAQLFAMMEYADEIIQGLTLILKHARVSVLRLSPEALAHFSSLAHLPPPELFGYIIDHVRNPFAFFMPFFVALNSVDVLERTATRAEQKEKPVLLTGADFMRPRTRKQAYDFFKLRHISPQLLIIRATRERLLSVSDERAKDPHTDPGRLMTDMHFAFPPYSPAEKWHPVLVVNNTGTLEDAVQEVRRKFARPRAFHVGNPVRLLHEPRVLLS